MNSVLLENNTKIMSLTLNMLLARVNYNDIVLGIHRAFSEHFH